MKIKIKNYQEEAINNLKKHFNSLYELKDKTIVFKSPTGSGKTFMISEFITQIVDENLDKDFCFIWATIGTGALQVQSYNAVTKYLKGSPKTTLLDENILGYKNTIQKNEIIFINWEKLISKDSDSGKWKNNMMKDQEEYNFIDLVNNTKKRNRDIVLIIDESHIGTSDRGKISEFRQDIINAKITIEMSATPLTIPDIEVNIDDVILEGMIKENIIVNKGINNDINIEDIRNSEELILSLGYEKRLKLKNEFNSLNINCNPLVLIQIPNKEKGDYKLSIIIDYLRDKGITIDNGKLKLWLSGGPEIDKDKIKELTDETEFLVFKTAVAIGWDCPRAQILVKFREGKSETFEIQTMGRILRTIEAKSYGNQLLDNAYLFTNLSSFIINKDSYEPNRIKTEVSKFRTNNFNESIYNQLNIISYYRSRANDYNSADSRFYNLFSSEFRLFFGININDHIEASNKKMILKGIKDEDYVNISVLAEKEISVLNLKEDENIYGKTMNFITSNADIENKYFNIISENMNTLAYVRSRSIIDGAIMQNINTYYKNYFRENKVISIQRLVVLNEHIFSEIISKSTQSFKQILIEESGRTGIDYKFEIEPMKMYARDIYKEINSKLSLYQPLRLLITNKSTNDVNRLELSFIEYIDSNQNNIDWFWQNGSELMKENFGISYNNGISTFQPDFIIKFKNGVIGIFDTKPIDDRIEDTTLKANALHNYVTSFNSENNTQILVGGIVISNNYNTINRRYHNFMINYNSDYVDFKSNAGQWESMDVFINNIMKDK